MSREGNYSYSSESDVVGQLASGAGSLALGIGSAMFGLAVGGVKLAAREINKSRLKRKEAEAVKLYLDRYQSVLNDMRNEGLVQYVQKQYEYVQSQLAQAQNIVFSNPEQARTISRSISSSIGVLPREAREIRRNEQMNQRRLQRQAEIQESQNRQREYERSRQEERDRRNAEINAINEQRQRERQQWEQQKRQQEQEWEEQKRQQEQEWSRIRQQEKKNLEQAINQEKAQQELLRREMEERQAEMQRAEKLHQQQIRLENEKLEAQRREIERQAQERQAEIERQEFLTSLPQKMANIISDSVEMDAVYEQYRSMQNKYRQMASSKEVNISQLSAQFEVEISELKREAENLAQQWRKNFQEKNQTEIAVEQVRMNREIVESTLTEATSPDLLKLIESLNALENDIVSGRVDAQQSGESISDIRTKTEKTIVNEELRKETISALVETIRAKGFVVNPPQLKNGVVELSAKRPNGQQCRFDIRLDGGFHYCFDQYEGSACKKDINEVKETLEKVYGIFLSDERVIWENPDRIDKNSVDKPVSEKYLSE